MGRETSRTDVGRQWNSLSSSEAMQAMQKMLASLERHADEAGKWDLKVLSQTEMPTSKLRQPQMEHEAEETEMPTDWL